MTRRPNKRPGIIHKTSSAPAVAAGGFTWQQVRDELAPGAGTALNIARLAVDRHAAGPLAQHTALGFLAADAAVMDLS